MNNTDFDFDFHVIALLAERAGIHTGGPADDANELDRAVYGALEALDFDCPKFYDIALSEAQLKTFLLANKDVAQRLGPTTALGSATGTFDFLGLDRASVPDGIAEGLAVLATLGEDEDGEDEDGDA